MKNYIRIPNNKIYNYENFYLKKLKKYFYHLGFISAYILYYLSLEKCYEGFDLCSLKKKWINKKINEAVISCIIIAILIELLFYKIIHSINLIHLIAYFIVTYIFSHGVDFEDHGYYNFLGGIALIILLIIAILPLNGLILIIRYKKKIYLIVFIITLLMLSLFLFLFSKYSMNCNDWHNGLNNSFIDNDKNKYGCYIKYPKYCPFKLGKYFFTNKKICKDKLDTKTKLIKFSDNTYINEETLKIGFPLPNKNMEIHGGRAKHMKKVTAFFKNNIIDLDNKTLLKNIFNDSYPEMIVDYTKNPLGELIINLQFNSTLSEERLLLENNSNPYSENLIVIFIDSVSRANSIRSLKKTLKFIEKFMQYKGSHNKNYPSENFHSFQFFKYHAFHHYTRYNYPQIFYGRVDGKFERNIKFLKENGYVTCYTNDMCYREPTNTGHNMTYNEISDHEILFCDPNHRTVFEGFTNCLYNKITSVYAFEYGTQFWRKYKYNRKYLSINLEDGHEGTLEILKYSDDIIYNFLKNLYNDNLLKSTSIFLLSDHGTQVPSIYYMNQFYEIERYLPMLYFICNDRKNIAYNKQYSNIYKNQQILITGYDIYNTIANLVFGDKYELIPNKTDNNESPKSELGSSLFNQIIPKERIPENYLNMTKRICVT